MTSIDHFIEFVRDECHRDGVRVQLVDAKYVMSDGLHCSGFFDSERCILKVAAQTAHWREILVHEFAHFTQWRAGTEIWRNGDHTAFFDWVTNKVELQGARATRECYLIRDLELDCERRALRLLVKHELPLDRANYVRRANCYLYSYQLMLERRQWPPTGAHLVPELYPLVPDRLLKRQAYNDPPEDFREIADRLFKDRP